MEKVIQDRQLWAGGTLYLLEFTNAFEVKFRRASPMLNLTGFEMCPYERRNQSSRGSIRLFRLIMKEVKQYIFTAKPPYLWFSIGGDKTRIALYKRLAKKLSHLGYEYADNPFDKHSFYCYKVSF